MFAAVVQYQLIVVILNYASMAYDCVKPDPMSASIASKNDKNIWHQNKRFFVNGESRMKYLSCVLITESMTSHDNNMDRDERHMLSTTHLPNMDRLAPFS